MNHCSLCRELIVQIGRGRKRKICKTCQPGRLPLEKEKIRRKQNSVCYKIHFCKNCSKPFTPKRTDRIQFCSRDCAYDHFTNEKKQNELKFLLPVPIVCRGCGVVSGSAYCSDACKRKVHKRGITNMLMMRRYVGLEKRIDTNRFRSCFNCGRSLNPTAFLQSRYCSKRCLMKTMRQLRNARIKAVERERFTALEIFRRDLYICWICRKPCRVDMAGTLHPMAPTVDHVIPLSKRGPHTRANCKTAHWRCNHAKRDKILHLEKGIRESDF